MSVEAFESFMMKKNKIRENVGWVVGSRVGGEV